MNIRVNVDFASKAAKWRLLAEHGFAESIGRTARDVRDVMLTALADEAPAYVGPARSSGREGGTFKRSVKANLESHGQAELTITFSAEAPLADWIIKGTRPHDIYPIPPNTVLSFLDASGRRVYARHVRHPGTSPNDFPGRAYDQVRGDIDDILSRTGRDVFARVA